MEVPTLTINNQELNNLVAFIYRHERMLSEFGAIRIRLEDDCKLSLKKRRGSRDPGTISGSAIRKIMDNGIYLMERVNLPRDDLRRTEPSIIDESMFWRSLSEASIPCWNISSNPNTSWFCRRTIQDSFDIYQVPRRSILRLGGSHLINNIIPCLNRAHVPGSFSALASTVHKLFSLNYMHEGGAQHWYFIPKSEREALQQLFQQRNISACLDHGQILIDPSFLDQNHIRYYRVKQHPSEFLVLSTGTLAQSFAENTSCSESIAFALPNWVGQHYQLTCECSDDSIYAEGVPRKINMTYFRNELTQRYINQYLMAPIHAPSADPDQGG